MIDPIPSYLTHELPSLGPGHALGFATALLSGVAQLRLYARRRAGAQAAGAQPGALRSGGGAPEDSHGGDGTQSQGQ